MKSAKAGLDLREGSARLTIANSCNILRDSLMLEVKESSRSTNQNRRLIRPIRDVVSFDKSTNQSSRLIQPIKTDVSFDQSEHSHYSTNNSSHFNQPIKAVALLNQSKP